MSLTIATLIIVTIFAIVGLFSIVATIANWNWFFNSSNARMLTGRMSRKAARFFYFIIGIAIIFMAIYLVINLK